MTHAPHGTTSTDAHVHEDPIISAASTVLLVDDDASVTKLVAFELRDVGVETVAVSDGGSALQQLEKDDFDVVVLDLGLPDARGEDILHRIVARWPHTPVIVLTGESDVEGVVTCMRLGATDYVHKPFDRTRLVTSIRNALEKKQLRRRVEALSEELLAGRNFGEIVGDSTSLKRSLNLIERAANSDVTVLVLGESGTGKELAAQALHRHSRRSDAPFITVNCGAIPETLIETELFGHEKGAFTGATQTRLGVFEQAHGGTLFLDEISELRPELQVRLLRVLEERAVVRVGGSRVRPIDVRVVAATHRDIKQDVATKHMREDLYYRLAVFPITLPPLRERGDDLMILAQQFLADRTTREQRNITGFTPDSILALRSHEWPGNVRELKNVIARAVLLEEGSEISLGSLPDEIVCAHIPDRVLLDAPVCLPADTGETHDITPLADVERKTILHALNVTSGNVQDAARRLGIARATIYRKLEKYGIDP